MIDAKRIVLIGLSMSAYSIAEVVRTELPRPYQRVMAQAFARAMIANDPTVSDAQVMLFIRACGLGDEWDDIFAQGIVANARAQK
jgi:hypothetical protein